MRGTTEEDHRRLSRFAESEKGAEVGISRDYDPAFALGAIENPPVVSALHPIFAYMSGVMSGLAQTFGDKRR